MADFEQPNGLAFAPDGRILYVSDTSRALGGDRHEIVAFHVGADHALRNRRTFAVVEPGVPDGLRVDRRGWVWAATEAGVQVFSPEGQGLGLIPTPQVAANLCFGPDEARVFITSKQHLYALDLASARRGADARGTQGVVGTRFRLKPFQFERGRSGGCRHPYGYEDTSHG